jgi:hypothetical protein
MVFFGILDLFIFLSHFKLKILVTIGIIWKWLFRSLETEITGNGSTLSVVYSDFVRGKLANRNTSW